MPGLRKHRPNLSEIAYDELKEMILTGELAQGERIILEKMSEKLNLSITPLREALNKLAQEDLIRATPRSSYEVISSITDDISDISGSPGDAGDVRSQNLGRESRPISGSGFSRLVCQAQSEPEL